MIYRYHYIKFLTIRRNEMNKNTLSYGLILMILFMLPNMVFAADESKDQQTKEKTPIELQRDKSQQLTQNDGTHQSCAICVGYQAS